MLDAKFFDGKRVVKDLKIVLKDFEPMIKDPKYLWNGRVIDNFNTRPREAWANWLICVVLQKIRGRDITFMDDDGGDGYIVDKDNKLIVQTEHVSALEIPKARKMPKGEQRVIDAINLKIAKGSEYAQGKLLVVFFDGAGIFFRDKIRKNIFGRHNFEAVFCVGLLASVGDVYSYSVTEFRDSFGEQSITHMVKIESDFNNWEVTQIMG